MDGVGKERAAVAALQYDLNYCIGMADYCDLLAILLQSPTPRLIEGLIDKTLIEDYRSIAGDCGVGDVQIEGICYGLESWCDALALEENPLSVVRREYTRLFSHPTRPAVPLYEGLFIRRVLDPSPSAEEVLFVNEEASDALALYRKGGVTAKGEVRIPPDCITTELEFLSYLEKEIAWMVSKGDEDGAGPLNDLLVEFVERHALKWFSPFFTCCVHEERGGLYGFVGEMGLVLVGSQAFCRLC